MSEPLLNPAQKKFLRRTLMMTLALLFLAEAWLWDHMGAFVARIIRHLPFEKWRAEVVDFIETLTPTQTLGLFIIPVMALLPFKFFALWLLAHGDIFSGILTILGAKLMGLGVTSFLFVLCKPKLLELRGVNWLYHKCLYWRARAHDLLHPYMRFIHRYTDRMKPKGAAGKLFARLRTQMHSKR